MSCMYVSPTRYGKTANQTTGRLSVGCSVHRWDNQVHEILSAVVVSVRLADNYHPSRQLQGKSMFLGARGRGLHHMKRVNKQHCKALRSRKFDAADSLLDEKVLRLVAKILHQMHNSADDSS
jgi:hypothetical protein